jgi:hypothetical protein
MIRALSSRTTISSGHESSFECHQPLPIDVLDHERIVLVVLRTFCFDDEELMQAHLKLNNPVNAKRLVICVATPSRDWLVVCLLVQRCYADYFRSDHPFYLNVRDNFK